MPRILDHIDLRVPDIQAARAFYEKLLPALGFTEPADIPNWVGYNAAGANPSEFFGFIESPGHIPNKNRIAFWAESNESVELFPPLLNEIRARNIEDPLMRRQVSSPFSSRTFGNRLEVCHRTHN